MDFVKKKLSHDTGLSEPELMKRMSRLKVGLRPWSPDNIHIQGPMTHFPNVVLNVGYGAQGFIAIGSSKITTSLIDSDYDEVDQMFD